MNTLIQPDSLTDNCSTIIIGKNASKTGHVLLAHNEDDIGCISQVHLVPRLQHKESEYLTFADGSAVILQVPETNAYIWTEFRSSLHELGGQPFADSFFNEYGVAVVSDSCLSSHINPDETHKEGLGYGLRRLIAERAKTAREGVEIAAALVSQYGYRSSRAYHICDKNEAWVFQVTTGENYAAQRIGDDEVYFMPNWYTIHQIDFHDTEHKKFYWSEDLVAYAIRSGRYTPAVPGDYSDFDFALAYQGDLIPTKTNLDRTSIGWPKLIGKPQPIRTFSVKAEKKYDVQDLKEAMRLHYPGHEEDLKKDPTMSPHRYGLCRDNTVEATVVEFHEETDLTCIWRSFPRPCASPYVPWYLGILKVPEGYSWMNYKAAQLTHFAVDESEFQNNSSLAYWAFHTLQNTLEFDYQYCQEMIHTSIYELENEWHTTKPVIDQSYLSLKETNLIYAKQMLTDYTCQMSYRAWDWAKQMLLTITNDRFISRRNFWFDKI